MRRTMLAVVTGTFLSMGVLAVVPLAASDTPLRFVTIDQNIDAATLARYHYTDQGTRILPAAWLAAVEKPDGTGKVMNPDDLRRLGFLVDNVSTGPENPYGWPIGFTVSDPKISGGVAVAGFTCAMCHTGQIEYRGTAIVIEGGQSMIDVSTLVDMVGEAFIATATNRALRNKFFKDAIAAGYPADRMEKDFEEAVTELGHLKSSTPGQTITTTPGGPGRIDAVQGIANRVFGTDLLMPANQRDATAPVNYPYLWDIWRLSRLQYNGFLPPNAVSRNIGEVLGVEGKTNMVNDKGELNPEPLRWQTSILLDALLWMEKTLQGLHSPTWPAAVLGPIDEAKADAGKALFTRHCAGCHGIKELPNGMWDTPVIPLDHVGTDPNQATNWAGYTYDLGILGLAKDAPAWVGIPPAVNAIRKQLYADNKTPADQQVGDVSVMAPCGYKARPLIGVWATPPFLHNGSVRTVFDLLSDTRPATFRFGTREYDPVNLGYTEVPTADDMVLDTTVSGNRNTGHWWTDEMDRPGRIGPKLADDEKYALIEFLKAATYDNYPREKRDVPAQIPCEGEQDWAIGPNGK